MRIIPVLIVAMLAFVPGAASGQSVEVYASAGPTILDVGNSVAAGVSFSPNSHLSVLANVERTHLSSRTTRDGGVLSRFRGGTLLLGSAELRVVPFGRRRVEPFGLVGFAAGVSRPNVNEFFPTGVTNDVRAVFAGGGLQIPLSTRVTAFADARMLLGAEGVEGIVAVAPLRAGVAWRF